MIGFLSGLLIKAVPGLLPEDARRYMKGFLLVVGIASLLGLGIHLIRKDAVGDHKAEIEQKTTEAKEKAADERLQDQMVNTKNETEMHNAIDNAPKGGTVSPAARALACERLRRLGRIPPTCGSEGTQ